MDSIGVRLDTQINPEAGQHRRDTSNRKTHLHVASAAHIAAGHTQSEAESA
jgi:hypothetical protein